MIAAQIGIGLTGAAAIWLSQDERPQWRRWSSILGLLGQPFWMIETATAGQWIVFALTIAYTRAWWRGFRTHWWPRRQA